MYAKLQHGPLFVAKRSVNDAAAGEGGARNCQLIGHTNAYVDLIGRMEALGEANIITATFRQAATHKLPGARIHLLHACNLLDGYVLSERMEIGCGAARLVPEQIDCAANADWPALHHAVVHKRHRDENSFAIGGGQKRTRIVWW